VRALIVYDTALNAYDLAPWHPLRPERVTLTLDLLAAYGLIRTRDDPAPGGFLLLSPRRPIGTRYCWYMTRHTSKPLSERLQTLPCV